MTSPARRRQAEADRVPLAAVPFGMHDPKPRCPLEPLQHAARAVTRPVVDDDDLALGGKVDAQQPLDHRGDGRGLVVDGDDDGDKRPGRGVRAQKSLQPGDRAALTCTPAGTAAWSESQTRGIQQPATAVHVRPSSVVRSAPRGPTAIQDAFEPGR